MRGCDGFGPRPKPWAWAMVGSPPWQRRPGCPGPPSATPLKRSRTSVSRPEAHSPSNAVVVRGPGGNDSSPRIRPCSSHSNCSWTRPPAVSPWRPCGGPARAPGNWPSNFGRMAIRSGRGPWPTCSTNSTTACKPTERLREGQSHPDRNTQFEYIDARVAQFQKRNQPVVSVDTQKKELIGNFKNPGAEGEPEGSPELVNVSSRSLNERGTFQKGERGLPLSP